MHEIILIKFSKYHENVSHSFSTIPHFNKPVRPSKEKSNIFSLSHNVRLHWDRYLCVFTLFQVLKPKDSYETAWCWLICWYSFIFIYLFWFRSIFFYWVQVHKKEKTSNCLGQTLIKSPSFKRQTYTHTCTQNVVRSIGQIRHKI